MRGFHIVIKVNGKVTADYQDPKRISSSGHLALQQNNPNTFAEFRSIEMREFPPQERAEPPRGPTPGGV